MRIERTGSANPLTPRVEAFLLNELGGVRLDDFHSPERTRIDFACLRGLLAVEVKTLEEPGTGRIDNLQEELRQRDDWPVFLGSAPMQSFIDNTNDPEGVQRRVLNRVGRAVINHLKKANEQFEAHAADFPRRNMMRLLLIANEDNEIYDPNTVGYILWHAVRRQEDGRPLYGNVDGIIYLTERHATVKHQKLTVPIVSIEGQACAYDSWKSGVLDFVAHRWGGSNDFSSEEFESLNDFVAIEQIPEQAPKYEWWRIAYRRQPYLRHLTKEQLRDSFDENAVLSLLFSLKNSPCKPSQEQSIQIIRRFGDFMQEMGHRGIPITEFAYELDRAIAAAKRLRLPEKVITWISEMEKHRR